MNFKKQAAQLEFFLDEEFKNRTPFLILRDNTIMYKKFKIKRAKDLSWVLLSAIGDKIGIFRLKATALIAAKAMDQNSNKKFTEACDLDGNYWRNFVDNEFFKEKIDSTSDFDKKDMFVARQDVVRERLATYKQKITSLFKTTFDK